MHMRMCSQARSKAQGICPEAGKTSTPLAQEMDIASENVLQQRLSRHWDRALLIMLAPLH
jgi:hypothetical protein